jgi:hypothetical protein
VRVLVLQREHSRQVFEIGLVVSSVLPPEQRFVVGITHGVVWNKKRTPAFFYTGALSAFIRAIRSN